jgi:hypothetical protein
MGNDSPNGHKYGLINIAAFLAQSMKETIQYNACDEISWDLVNGVYPVSNACGQLGQSYQDYKCSAEEAHKECPVNPNMKIKATTNAKWYGAPAPLYCRPKTDYPFTDIGTILLNATNPGQIHLNTPKNTADKRLAHSTTTLPFQILLAARMWKAAASGDVV